MTQTQDQPAIASTLRSGAYATLLVHAEASAASSHRVAAAARIARRIDARLIGLGAEAFEPVPTVDPFMGYAAGEWVAMIQEQIGKDLENAEAAFRRDAAGADIEWRSVQDFPARALARAARAADLIVASPKGHLGSMREADPAEVVMTAGRPVLIVPQDAQPLRGNAVVVAWKDTREARRAVADAIPFLAAADDVIVQAVCEGDAVEAAAFQTEDVAASLRRHGVRARAKVSSAPHGLVARELLNVARSHDADLIVAGAYGHNRLQEWAFGGVTDEFIRAPGCFVLMSH